MGYGISVSLIFSLEENGLLVFQRSMERRKWNLMPALMCDGLGRKEFFYKTQIICSAQELFPFMLSYTAVNSHFIFFAQITLI